MLIASAPVRREASEPLVSNSQQWEVTIIDSSKSGHGKTDTRHQTDGSFRQGVGQGVFRVYTDAAGKVIGHAWSTSRKSEFRSQSERPVVIGRLRLEALTSAR
jgi:hypothetical protein